MSFDYTVSQQHASVSQGRVYLHNCICFYIGTEVADQICYLTQSQYIDTGPTSPSTNSIMPGACKCSHVSTDFYATVRTQPGKTHVKSGVRSKVCCLFFFFCLPSYISGAYHSSSSAFPAIFLGLTILLLLLLPSQLYFWGLPFFFCLPSYISGAYHSSSSSAFPAIFLGLTILLLLLPSQLYFWGLPFFFCPPSYISGAYHTSSSSAFPAIFLGLTNLLMPSQLYF